MGSTIPAARANLYAMLSDAATLAEPVQVVFGPPIGYQARECVAILGVSSLDTDDKVLATSGPVQEESYAIHVHIQTWDESAAEADVPDVDARLWALYDAFRDVVMADRTLDGALSATAGWANVATGDPEDSPAPAVNDSGQQHGWVAWVRCKVLCRARIS